MITIIDIVSPNPLMSLNLLYIDLYAAWVRYEYIINIIYYISEVGSAALQMCSLHILCTEYYKKNYQWIIYSVMCM